MIPFEFEYYKPEKLWEAAAVFIDAQERGKEPVYYGGGSELISMARAGNLTFGAVIDIKGIPELRENRIDGDYLKLGAGLTLDEIKEDNKFPLLSKCAGRIADHTMQRKITLGGNLKSTIIYREAALALLLSDAKITISGPEGIITRDFNKFTKLPSQKNELIVSISVPRAHINAPYFHIKKTKNEKIDYPLITVAGLIDRGKNIRAAFSGLYKNPVRDKAAEAELNNRSKGPGERADAFCKKLSCAVTDDLSGSAGYKMFVLKNTIINMLEAI